MVLVPRDVPPAPVLNPMTPSVVKAFKPERLLEGTALVNMSGLLNQMEQLSAHAASIFQDLLTVAGESTKRIAHLGERVRNLSESMPAVEQFARTVPLSKLHQQARSQWSNPAFNTTEFFSVSARPEHLQKLYSTASSPPNLSLMDQFMDNGDSCLSKYTNPKFFMEKWRQEMDLQEQEMLKLKKERREAARARRAAQKAAAQEQKKAVRKVQKVVYDPLTGEKKIIQEDVTDSTTPTLGTSGSSANLNSPNERTSKDHSQKKVSSRDSSNYTPSAAAPPPPPMSHSSSSSGLSQQAAPPPPSSSSSSSTTVSYPPPPGRGAPPSVSALSSPTMAGSVPPPPPPPSSSSKRSSAAVPSSSPSSSSTGGVPPPPPPPSSLGVLPRAVSVESVPLPPSESEDGSVAEYDACGDGGDGDGGAPPPPPPPAGLVPAAPPPPNFAGGSSRAKATEKAPAPAPAPDRPSMGALGEQLRGGASLKHVDRTAVEPKKEEPRSSLLDSIKGGVSLKKVTSETLPKKEEPKEMTVAAILARRIAIQESDDEDADDDEWSD
eukprot:TRINITY_DN147_c0_g1_i1.p1 TRINITY_DN147_c0_g1~~TRINITY_DN147_c0_g1_i1.p1  ORF type:complete len:550 (+),score=151.50 TRINITY_DN147_c0_g1_i1:56-1705(+)